MTETFSCGDMEALVSYLYDESLPAEREVIEKHLAGCASCARELGSLGATRRQLAAWTPPEATLGFRITSGALSPPPPPVWWRQPLPAWMQMAAAVLLFAAGLTVGAIRGSNPENAASTSASVAPSATVPVSTSVAPRDLTELEQRLREEMAQLRAAAPVAVSTQGRERGDAVILTQVRNLIQESEERQRRELALRTAQIIRDVENQRRVDLTQVQRTWGQVQGLTDAEVRQQREMLNFLTRRVSQ